MQYYNPSICLLLDFGQDFRVADQEVFFVAHLNLVATPRWQQHLVTGLHASGHYLAILVGSTRASGDDRSFRHGRRA